MPKGRHKGKAKQFSSPEELEEQRKAAERARLAAATGGNDDDEDEESDEEEGRHKGVSHLIEVHNPNRMPNKMTKVSEIGQGETSSRRQKELDEAARLKQQADRNQLEADLARLAIIRKQREEEERIMAEKKRLKELRTEAASNSPSPTGRGSKK